MNMPPSVRVAPAGLILLLALLILLALLTSACKQEASTAADPRADRRRPLICTTIHPLQFYVQRLAGELVDCEVITPTGADPRHWVPDRRTLEHLATADLVIFHGAELEPFADKVALARSRRWTVCTGFDQYFLKIKAAITHTHGGKSHTHDGIDPYLWLDLSLASRQAAEVARALGHLLPDAKQQFAANLTALQGDFVAVRSKHRALIGETERVYATERLYDYWGRSHQVEVIVLGLAEGPVDQARLTAIRATLKSQPARVILCRRAPELAWQRAFADLGLTPVIFDPCFTATAGQDFLQIMAANHTRLHAAQAGN